MPAPFAPWQIAFKLVFVLYCTTVGLVLLYAPWTPTWGSLVAALPPTWSVLGNPWVRGATSGFGIIHLVWVLNEFDDALRPRDVVGPDR